MKCSSAQKHFKVIKKGDSTRTPEKKKEKEKTNAQVSVLGKIRHH